MNKIVRYVIPLILIFSLVSCSKDDPDSKNDTDSSQQEEFPFPSSFNVNAFPEFNSVYVVWSVEQGEANENLSYAIFIDDELITENLTENSYTVMDLEMSTVYNLKVVAKNDNGETPIEKSFETLNPKNFRFLPATCQNGVDEPIITYGYNGNGSIVESEYSRNGFVDFVSFQYNGEGKLQKEKLTTEINGDFFFGSTVEFIYENNQIIEGYYADSGDSNITYDFSSPDNYNIDNYFGATITSSRNVILERNDGKITSCLVTDVNNQEIIYHVNFSYSNGNLVELNNILSGEIWVFEYDNKNNFYYHQSYLKRTLSDMSHITYPIGDAYYRNGFVPEFVDYFNKNNPTKIFKNGELIHTLTYEYTDFDYPSKIYLDDSKDPVLLTYTYVPN